MRKREIETIHYNPHELPPRTFWTVQFNIPRAIVPQLCEQLHAIVSERLGADFYYPNVLEKETTCRYEWHRAWRGDRFALRVGLMFPVGNNDLSEITAYVTTNQAVADPATGPPVLPQSLITRIKQECFNTLVYAINRLQPQAQKSRHIVFHIEMPYKMGVSNEVQTEDGRIHIFPTIIVKDKNKRVSAISVTVNAASNEAGKAQALRDVVLICALLSLANQQVYQTTTLKWSRNRPPVKYLDSVENVDVQRLYPFRKHPPSLESLDKRVPGRFQHVWDLYNKLSNEDRGAFLATLFAYYSALEIQGRQPTIAVVGYIAALSSLAKSKIQKCLGKLSCSECGPLQNFQHNIVGDRAAITSLISHALALEELPEKKRQLETLIKDVYQKQRSAFVHGAIFRHSEIDKNNEFPLALPALDEPVSELYFYRRDLFSIARITRWTLLEWLAQKVGTSLDKTLLGLDRSSIFVEFPIEGSVHLSSSRLAALKVRPE